MGAEVNILSNLFLPFGKVRMGYPSGEARWGLKSVYGAIIPHGSELLIENSFYAQPVYLGLSLVCFCEVATSLPPISVVQVNCRELALVRATCAAGIKP